MNYEKAFEKAKEWVANRPNELVPKDIEDVLTGLGFELKGKNADYTTYRSYHKNIDRDYFKYGLLKISVHHSKSGKAVVLVGSVQPLLKALSIIVNVEEWKMKKNMTQLMKYNYKIIIEFLQEDNSFIAWHKELGRGSCYGIGSTIEEAVTALSEDKEAFFEILISENKEIPLPEVENDSLPSGQLVLRMPKTLHKEIKELAAREGVSINQYIVSALSKDCGRRQLIDLLNASSGSNGQPEVSPRPITKLNINKHKSFGVVRRQLGSVSRARKIMAASIIASQLTEDHSLKKN